MRATVLTDDGEAAFPDYQAGTAFDPLTLHLPTSTELRRRGSTGGDAGSRRRRLRSILVARAVRGPLALVAPISSS